MNIYYWFPFWSKRGRKIRKNMSKKEKRGEYIYSGIFGLWFGLTLAGSVGLFLKYYVASTLTSDRLLLIICMLIAFVVGTPFLSTQLFRYYNSSAWAKDNDYLSP